MGLFAGFDDGVARVADCGYGVAIGFQADGQRFADVDLIVNDENVEGLMGRRFGHVRRWFGCGKIID